MAKNPTVFRKVKITRANADELALDPHFNDPSRSVDFSNFKTIEMGQSKPMKARYRDKRGAYQSIDFD